MKFHIALAVLVCLIAPRLAQAQQAVNWYGTLAVTAATSTAVNNANVVKGPNSVAVPSIVTQLQIINTGANPVIVCWKGGTCGSGSAGEVLSAGASDAQLILNPSTSPTVYSASGTTLYVSNGAPGYFVPGSGGGGGGGSVTQGTVPWQDQLVAGTAIVGKVGIDQTTPGNTNGVQVVAPLPAGANLIGGVNTAPSISTPSSEAGGTVTAGNTFQQVLAANALRTSCVVQNTSTHTAYVYWLGSGTPTLLNAMQIAAGNYFNCASAAGGVIKTAIQWTTGTTSDPYVVGESQ